MSIFFWTSYSKTLRTFMLVADILKCACGQEEVVQLGDVSRGFSRHADRWKVIVVNLGYFSAWNTGILSYKIDKSFPLCDITHKFRSSRPEVLCNNNIQDEIN